MPELEFRFPSREVTSLLLNRLLEGFREEQFFVHTFNSKEGLYQVRKDAMTINIKKDNDKITFKCAADEMPFVRLVMTEVVVQIEQTVKALQHPFDPAEVLAAANKEEDSRRSRNSRMRRYISVDNVIPVLNARTKEQAIEQIVRHMAAHGIVHDVEKALTEVLKREETMSTGLRHGLACPHARTSEVRDLVCAIAIVPEGIDFDSMDGKPTNVIQLILCPAESNAPYMELMAATSGIYRDETSCNSLLKCKTPKEMYSTICRLLSA